MLKNNDFLSFLKKVLLGLICVNKLQNFVISLSLILASTENIGRMIGVQVWVYDFILLQLYILEQEGRLLLS